MAGPFYVDDGGDGTDGLTWAKAETSINDLDTATVFASGEIVYFGADSQCQATNAANLTITGPTSGAPVIFISATQGSSPATYAQATGNQIDTTEGAYSVTFDGSFALHGIKINSGLTINATQDADESFYAENCIFAPAANSYFYLSNSRGKCLLVNPVFDLTADGTTNRNSAPIQNSGSALLEIINPTFVNADYRTGVVFGFSTAAYGVTFVSGGDFSGFTNATACELFVAAGGHVLKAVGLKTAATWTAFSGTVQSGFYGVLVNCGSADDPVALQQKRYEGDTVSSSSIYRTSGASFESTANAWLITTTAACSVDAPYYTEYIYGTISSTGSKTFDLYVTNDTADLNNDEIWLEVEYKADASSGKWTLITDKPANRTTAAAAQTDDTTSTWNGTGPSFTYKQKLSVTATVNTTGQFRARVAVGKASIASSAYLYIDPLVTVS